MKLLELVDKLNEIYNDTDNNCEVKLNLIKEDIDTCEYDNFDFEIDDIKELNGTIRIFEGRKTYL